MREILVTIFSSILFLGFLAFALLEGIPERMRLPFFYYPSGLIANIGIQNQDIWGKKANPNDLIRLEKSNEIKPFEKISIWIQEIGGEYKEHQFQLVQFKKWETVYYFGFDLILSFLFLVSAVYFYAAMRDGLILCFFLNLSFLVFSNVFLLAFHSLIYLYFFSIYAGAFLFYHLIYRLRGKEIQSKWLLPQFLIASMVGILASQENQDLYLLERIAVFGFFLTSVFVGITIFLNTKDLLVFKPRGEALLKKISLISSLIMYVTLPVCMILFNGYPIFSFHRVFFFLVNILFLICFFYGTYRYSLVASFVIFTPTLVTLLLVSFWTFVYLALVLVASLSNPSSYLNEKWFLNILFLFLFAIYLLPSKIRIKGLIDYWFFEKNANLKSGIEQITKLIAAPISMRKTIVSLNRIVSKTLNVKNVTFLIPGDQFPGVDLKNINFIRIPSQSEIWNFFQGQSRVTVTSHLEHGIGIRETLYNFLKDLGVQLAFPILQLSSSSKSIKAMVLFGEKSNNSFYSIGELKFINEVTRICSMMLENYTLLEDEIQKRKILRDIQTASIVDNTLRTLPPSEIKGIDYSHLVRPAVGISGDYLDMIPISSSSVVILLGDVAGHGLGTGFLVSAIKGLVRENLKLGRGLVEIFKEINSFFRARYKGNEFMTLLGGVIDTKKRTFEYINAGHLALVEQTSKGEILLHSKTQRVLGILETDYELQTLPISEESRLFLFSDGVTETFSQRGETFGEELLTLFLKENQSRAIKELPSLLEERLNLFRSSPELTDDITFIALSFSGI